VTSGQRRWAALVAVLLYAPVAQAMQAGITGYSGKQGATCNDDCHIGGVAPLVRFEGPRRVMTDAVATFRFVVTSQSTRQKVAGFNVAATDGMLDVLSGQAEHLEFDELTHDAPKPNVSGEAGWVFSWKAPTQLGVYRLYGAGLSANGNGTDGGDDSDLAVLDVTVTSDVIGDTNCDARLSAADVTAAAILLPGGVAAACSGADADGSGAVDAGDVAVVVAALFGD
jgi:hypothetical protein